MIKHLFVSTAIDDGDSIHVQGTQWNQDHEIDDPTALTAVLSVFTSSLKGLAPASGGGTSNFLRADGTWAPSSPSNFSTSVAGIVPASGSGSTYLKGDATWSTATTLTAFLNAFSSSLKGLVPSSGGGTVNYLRADGQFVPSVPSNAGDPNASVTATKGSLIRDTTNGNLYINSDGATAWSRLARVDVISVKDLGDGSDGAAVFDGVAAVTGFTGPVSSVYTATRETAFTTGTFAPGVVLEMTQGGAHAGYRIFFNSTVTVTSGTATIKYNGLAAALSVAGGSLGNNPQGNNSAAGAGGIQNAGQVGSNAGSWTNRIKGGTGGAGGSSPTNVSGAGGTVGTTFAASIGEILTWEQALLSRVNLANPGIISGGAGGGSGAGTVGVASGGGGGGGAGVGVVGIGVLASTGTLVIEARGGVGGNAGTGGGSNAAGGGGGGGGVLFVGFGGSVQPSNLTVQCPGGAGGVQQGTGNPGGTGGTGSARFYPLGPG